MAAGTLGEAFVKVKADLSSFPAELRAKLKTATEEGVQGVNFSGIEHAAEEAGDKAAKELGDELEKKAKPNAERAGRNIGASFVSGFGVAMRGLGAAFIPTLIGLAVEVVAALGPAIGLIGAALPVAIMTAVSAMGVLALATHGVGQAIGAAFSGDPAKLAEAMKGLAPAARSFVNEIQAARPALTALQQDVQQTFFVQLQGVLTTLIASVLPTLRVGLHALAADFGQIGRAVALAFAGEKGNLAKTFTGIHAALQPIIPMMASLVHLFGTLSAAAIPFVVKMSGGMASLVERFTAFIDRVNQSGQLAAFFQAGLDVLSALGQTLGNISRLVIDIFTALQSTGSDALGIIGQLAGTLAAFFGSAAGQNALAAVFNLLNVALDSLAQILTPLLPVVSQFAGVLADELANALMILTPSLVNVASAFAQFLTDLQPLLPLISAIATDLAPVLDFLTKFPDLVVAAAIAWAAYGVAQKAATVAATAFDVAADANPIGAIVLGIEALIVLIVLLVMHWKTVAHWGTVAWDAIKDAASAVWSFLQGAWDGITGFFEGIITWFENLPGTIWNFVMGIPEMLENLFRDAFLGVVQMIGFGIGLIIGELLLLPGQIWSALSSLGSLLGQIFRDAFDWVMREINAGWINLTLFFVSLPDRIMNFVNGLPGRLRDWASNMWQGIQDKFREGTDAVVGFARSLPGRISGFFDNVGHDILSGLRSGINSVVDAFNRGIDNAAGFLHIPLPHLPHFAQGGIINGPTLAVIGEGGAPEVVLPTNNLARATDLLERSGIMAQLRNVQAAPVVNVTAVLGTGEILSVIDSRVDKGMAGAGAALAGGVRSL